MSRQDQVKPAVTVIVRSHDQKRYARLQRALFSIWSQDTPDCVEVLLVTSGYGRAIASDACTAYLGGATQHYAPAGPRVFRHVRTAYSGDTRARLLNTGLMNAAGEYLFFLDDDDVLRSGGLRRLLARARDTCADIVFGGVDLVFDYPILPPESRKVCPYNVGWPTKSGLVRHNTAPLCSYLLKRPSPEMLPLVDSKLCSHEDYAMLLQALRKSALTTLDDGEAVSEYWIAVGGNTQASKYKTSIADDMTLIEELKRSLVYELSAEELAASSTTDRQDAAFAELLDVIPYDMAACMEGRVDQVVKTRFGYICMGWACRKARDSSDVPLVFAIHANGHARLVENRFSRPDVAIAKARRHDKFGFSYGSRERPQHFVVVAGGMKMKISLGDED